MFKLQIEKLPPLCLRVLEEGESPILCQRLADHEPPCSADPTVDFPITAP